MIKAGTVVMVNNVGRDWHCFEPGTLVVCIDPKPARGFQGYSEFRGASCYESGETIEQYLHTSEYEIIERV